jgi:hypothetical protein
MLSWLIAANELKPEIIFKEQACVLSGYTHEEVVLTLRGTFSSVRDFWWVENKQGKHQTFLRNAS